MDTNSKGFNIDSLVFGVYKRPVSQLIQRPCKSILFMPEIQKEGILFFQKEKLPLFSK